MQLTVWHTTDAPEPVRFAASELARYLARMASQDVAILVGSADGWPDLEVRVEQSSSAPTAPSTVLDLLARQVQPVARAFARSPGVDAFSWQTGAASAAIVGTNPRSTLFGVYDLLEEFGCRFFSPDPDDAVVTQLDPSAFDQRRERFEQATFAYRERHLLEWIDAEATRREIDHAAKRRMNGFAFHIEDFAPDAHVWNVVLKELVPEIARRGLLPGLGEHGGYALFLPPQRYAAEHPDWYAQIGGRRIQGFRANGERYQFCTEHPVARRTFLGNLEAFLAENPEIRIMHIAPEDVGRWCECPLCTPVPIADRYLRLDNAIAELVGSMRPDASVTHLVYANHVELPQNERPGPNLKISFVPFGRDFGRPLTDPRANMHNPAHPWSLELIEDWARLCQETGAGLIEHTKGFRQRWITFRLLPLPHLASDMRWWRRIGADGFNAPQEGEGWWVKHLNAYVFARLMWDLDMPVTDLLDDYFERYWEAIGPQVREIYTSISDALPNLSYARNQPALLHNRSQGVRLPPEEELGHEVLYLERAITQLGEVAGRVSQLRQEVATSAAIERRLSQLADAIEGALAGLEVSLSIRRYVLTRGKREAAQAGAAHERFVALQTPQRLSAGTLWTGRWQRSELFAEWERAAATLPV